MGCLPSKTNTDIHDKDSRKQASGIVSKDKSKKTHSSSKSKDDSKSGKSKSRSEDRTKSGEKSKDGKSKSKDLSKDEKSKREDKSKRDEKSKKEDKPKKDEKSKSKEVTKDLKSKKEDKSKKDDKKKDAKDKEKKSKDDKKPEKETKAKDKSSSSKKADSKAKPSSSDKKASKPPKKSKSVNPYEDRPISKAKNVSTKSWWEMDDNDREQKSPDPFMETTRSSPSVKKGYSRTDDLNGDLEKDSGDNSGHAGKPDYMKTSSSENISGVRFRNKGAEGSTSNHDLNRSIRSVRSVRSARSDRSAGRGSKAPEDEASSELNQSDTYKSGFDDSFNCRDSNPSDNLSPPPSTFNGEFNDYGDDSVSSGVSPKRAPFGKQPFGGSVAPFSDSQMNGDEPEDSSFPSRPTHVPGRAPFSDDPESSEPRPSPSGFTPRPKFKRPMPLKRGAGMVNRKLPPTIKTPEESMTDLLGKMSKLDVSKFNDHLKMQKELIDLIGKSPEVISKMEVENVMNVVRNIVEVGGNNRTNVGRSCLISLAHIFDTVGQSIGNVVVPAMTLAAKKGVSSSSDHLISASNFLMSKVCSTAMEAKVASQLISLFKNNRAYQNISLSGALVLVDRMGEEALKLKNLDGIVQMCVKGITSGNVVPRTISRHILGHLSSFTKLDPYYHACHCTPIEKVTVTQCLSRYDAESKDEFIRDFKKPIAL